MHGVTLVCLSSLIIVTSKIIYHEEGQFHSDKHQGVLQHNNVISVRLYLAK